mmetsp:Transcript_8573/g.25810  ORF Transcript_8573/g.25810 Transcript_8573/m.25810 type:complete len:141 (+) Transcript_8573:189-611(+)
MRSLMPNSLPLIELIAVGRQGRRSPTRRGPPTAEEEATAKTRRATSWWRRILPICWASGKAPPLEPFLPPSLTNYWSRGTAKDPPPQQGRGAAASTQVALRWVVIIRDGLGAPFQKDSLDKMYHKCCRLRGYWCRERKEG